MKPYLYLSDAKVEQHFLQIRQSFLSTAKADKFRLKLSFADAEFSDITRPLDRYSKLAAVISELADRETIGSLQQPKLYFQGTLEMNYGIYPNTEVVYFSGRDGDTIVGLIGSLKHVEAAQELKTLTRSGWGSMAVGMTRDLAKELDLTPIMKKYEADADVDASLGFLVGQANRLTTGATARVEFVAIRLDEGRFEGCQTLLGTPFYVAYAT
jgi:hypothetical protein